MNHHIPAVWPITSQMIYPGEEYAEIDVLIADEGPFIRIAKIDAISWKPVDTADKVIAALKADIPDCITTLYVESSGKSYTVTLTGNTMQYYNSSVRHSPADASRMLNIIISSWLKRVTL